MTSEKYRQKMKSERGHNLGRRHWRMLVAIGVATALCLGLATVLTAQQTGGANDSENLESDSDNRVEVQPVSSDRAIEDRLTSIIKASGWFDQTKVTVADGVGRIEYFPKGSEGVPELALTTREPDLIQAIISTYIDESRALPEIGDMPAALLGFLGVSSRKSVSKD